MKNPLQTHLYIIKNNVSLLLGVLMAGYGALSFKSDFYDCHGPSNGWYLIRDSYECLDVSTFYYYENGYIALIITGLLFITFGLLKLRAKK